MNIIIIFETGDQSLFSVKYHNERIDEFDRLFDLWQDIEYLYEFFCLNIQDLESAFYGSLTIDRAIWQTRKDAKELQKEFYRIGKSMTARTLDELFKPLDNLRIKLKALEKSKCYGVFDKSWIRLYAIRIDKNCYLITGGAIKLTYKMSDREHTVQELDKLDKCRDYLGRMGIFDEDGIKDFVKE